MSTHLSRHFKKCREAKTLRYGDAARLCGYKNVTKGANKIIRFEERGSIQPNLFDKLKTILEVDDATVDELVHQDQEDYLRRWREWASQPVPMVVYRRRLPAFAAYWQVPEEITTEEEAVEWACQQARNGWGPLLLNVNRIESIGINEKGEVEGRYSRTPKDSLPYLQIGRHKFRFVAGPNGLEMEINNAPNVPQNPK